MTASVPPTIIIRHRKENLKKCSLKGLEKRKDFAFFRYPLQEIPLCEHYILLSLQATEELSLNDSHSGLLILDATWKLAALMEKNLFLPQTIKRRSLPRKFTTAYPRRQNDCADPSCGLASIEAIAAAYAVMGRSYIELLDHYYWKDSFLEKNKTFLLQYLQGP